MRITDEYGVVLRAEIDVSDGSVVLHSRSGKNRNPDYKVAFMLMVDRLRLVGLRPGIFLDSNPVQQLPLSERQVWAPPEFMPTPEMFAEVVKRMNSLPGSSSHGAWRRLLFDLSGVPSYSIASVIAGANPRGRLPNKMLERVTPQHLARAVRKTKAGHFPARFSAASDYRIILDEGVHLPPKAVFAWALGEALQIFPIPDHFSGGVSSTSTRIMREAGYRIEWCTGRPIPSWSSTVVPKASPEEVEAALQKVPHSEDDKIWIEGDLRRANHLRRERGKGIAAKKKAAFIAKHGKLFCELCKCDPVEDYETEDAIACIEVHHRAVSVGDMQPGHETALDDLQCLCANCHRLVHRQMKSETNAHQSGRSN